MNIVVYSDSPTVPTGFGVVTKNIFGGMMERGFLKPDEVNFFGVNFTGDHHGTHFRVWPAQVAAARDPDLHGRSRFAQMLHGGVWGEPDVLFFLLDHFTFAAPLSINGQPPEPFIKGIADSWRKQHQKPLKVIQYIPVDGEVIYPDWVSWMPGVVDYPVAYTEWGRRMIGDTDKAVGELLQVIPHGTNVDEFYPLSTEERRVIKRDILHVGPDDPVIVNVNRNQPRKDIPRTLQIFQQVRRKFPNALLYLHMNPADSQGTDLNRTIFNLRIPRASVKFPGEFSEGIGVPIEALNRVYNAADVFLTTARGEGWGLSLTEAMTVGLPCVAPRHTSFAEILAEDRGMLVDPESYGAASSSDNDQLRPVADVGRMAEEVIRLLEDSERARAMGDRAREWALAHSWKTYVVPMWEKIFKEAATPPSKSGRFAFRGGRKEP